MIKLCVFARYIVKISSKIRCIQRKYKKVNSAVKSELQKQRLYFKITYVRMQVYPSWHTTGTWWRAPAGCSTITGTSTHSVLDPYPDSEKDPDRDLYGNLKRFLDSYLYMDPKDLDMNPDTGTIHPILTLDQQTFDSEEYEIH